MKFKSFLRLYDRVNRYRLKDGEAEFKAKKGADGLTVLNCVQTVFPSVRSMLMNRRQFSAAIIATLAACINPAFADGGCPSSQDLSSMPPHQIGMYLDGYHTYRSEANLTADQQKQIRTAHFCKQVNPDLFQCVIYSGNTRDARAIGIEYVITAKAFDKLSESEKKYWHKHDGEVDSGLLVMPGLDKEKEKATLDVLRGTYGKTWQTWNNLADDVPIGEPALMWNVDVNKISAGTKKSAAARAVDPTY